MYVAIRDCSIPVLGHVVKEHDCIGFVDLFKCLWIDQVLADWAKGASLDTQQVYIDDELALDFVHSSFLEEKLRVLWGFEIEGFEDVVFAMISYGRKPESEKDLDEWIGYLREGDLEVYWDKTELRVLSRTQTREKCLMVFSDDINSETSAHAEYLLRSQWEFPLNYAASCIGVGSIYCVHLSASDRETIVDVTGVTKIVGGRLPDIASLLKDGNMEWPNELIILRAAMLLQNVDSLTDFFSQPKGVLEESLIHRSGDLYEMFSVDPAFLSSTTRLKTQFQQFRDYITQDTQKIEVTSQLVQVSEHFCQYRVYEEIKELGYATLSCHFYFDDLWLEENQGLADSLFLYAKGWDE